VVVSSNHCVEVTEQNTKVEEVVRAEKPWL